jgi:hypothetical protein
MSGWNSLAITIFLMPQAWCSSNTLGFIRVERWCSAPEFDTVSFDSLSPSICLQLSQRFIHLTWSPPCERSFQFLLAHRMAGDDTDHGIYHILIPTQIE